MGTLTHKTHNGPDSGEATTFPHIVFSATLHRGYIQMALFPGTPKLESRNCTETIPVRVLGLWALIAPDFRVWSWRGLNQSCSPRQDLSNSMSHSQFGGQEEVDSRPLMVGSQTASLTPDPSFAHNLGFRYPNDQCEAIFDIYSSRPFQCHQEHPNARCFGLCCRTLNIREFRRTPNPQLWEWEFHPPTSPKVGLRHWFWFEPTQDGSICPMPFDNPICIYTQHSHDMISWKFLTFISLATWCGTFYVTLCPTKRKVMSSSHSTSPFLCRSSVEFFYGFLGMLHVRFIHPRCLYWMVSFPLN